MFSGRVLRGRHGWFPVSLEGRGRAVSRRLRVQLASLWPKGQFPTVRKGSCSFVLRSEDTEIRFKGMATYEHGPEFRKALSSVERLDWHGEPISSLPGLF